MQAIKRLVAANAEASKTGDDAHFFTQGLTADPVVMFVLEFG
jgi:hypothetical protein